MKITLLCTKGGWHAEELAREVKKRGIGWEKVYLSNFNDLGKEIGKMGDIVIWFSSGLKTLEKKAILFHLLKEKLIIDTGCLKFPFLSRKLFQQKYLENYSKLDCIPTFCFQNKEQLLTAIPEKLSFPIIQKPNMGSQGDNILLLKSKLDIQKEKRDISKNVYQNFIPNDGDYRVFVLGKKVLGAIKRTAKAGSYLNNVSKGGSATKVSDPGLLKTLSKIALTATSTFDLSICGIDVIYDKKTDKYRLMELNTNPEWKGFQGATKINVASKIIDYCMSIHKKGLKK